MLQSVVVGKSTSRPFANDVFSGLVLLEETVVKAVVVSDIVGKGRPITVTTAAAIPPVPLAAAKPPAMPLEGKVFVEVEVVPADTYKKTLKKECKYYFL